MSYPLEPLHTHTQTHTERERESHPATKEGTQDEFPEKGPALHL